METNKFKSLSENILLTSKKYRRNNEKIDYIELFKNHPILIFNIFAVIGGLINLMYFFKIGYLPMLKIEDAFFLFLVSGFVGLIFIFLTLSYLVFPAISYKSFKSEDLKNITYSEKLAIDEKLKQKLFLFPMFTYIVFSLFAISLYSPDNNNNMGIFIIWLSINMIIPALVFQYHITSQKIAFKFKSFYKYNLIIYLSYFFMLFSFIISVSILQNSKDLSDSEFYYLLLLGTFIFIFLAVNIKNTKYIEQLSFSLLFLFILLFFTHTYHVIPFAIMKSFNLGQIEISSIQVNKNSCKILTGKNKEPCQVSNLILLWRSGKNFILEKKPQENETKIKRTIYVIPIESVQGWEKQELIKKKKEEINKK